MIFDLPHSKTGRNAGLLVLLSVVCALPGGCAKVDFDKMRSEHVKSYPDELMARTIETLPSDGVLGLNDCLRIALANNLDVSIAEIDRRLAGMDRKIAFSNFLPQIDVGVNWHSANHQQKIASGGGYNAMADRTVTDAVLSAQQAIFMPETWYLYDAYKKGEGVSELLARRTRDLIRLQVTTLYYSCLSLEKAHEAIESSLEQAEAIGSEVQALADEDMAMPSQVEKARTLLEAQKAALAANERQQVRAMAALMEAMGLSPLAAANGMRDIDIKISLGTEAPLKLADRDLADQVLDAMLSRPELGIADRTIEIRKDQTRMAIAQFLPKLVGFSDLTHTGDSFLKYSNVWSYGISGTMSVFDGFANIHEYKAAKERQKKAVVDRERQCVKIMLEVVNARSQYDQARDQQAVALQELKAANTEMNELVALWQEGMLMSSDRLAAVSHHAVARANAASAEFQLQVTAATLLDVMGKSPEGSNCE